MIIKVNFKIIKIILSFIFNNLSAVITTVDCISFSVLNQYSPVKFSIAPEKLLEVRI